MLVIIRHISKKISRCLVWLVLLNTITPLYAQQTTWQKIKTGVSGAQQQFT
jgi:hypothetical protein